MYLQALVVLLATAQGLPSSPGVRVKDGFLDILRTDAFDSPDVLHALSDPSYYDHLSNPTQQTPLQLASSFPATSSTCGAKPICPAYEGETISVNGRNYLAYCINAPWGTYFWLPKSSSLSECERKCHEHSGYDCNALTFYPSTGACSLIYSTDSQPSIWDNGYQKVGLIREGGKAAFGPGMVCPLPGSDNQVWDFGHKKEYQFKMSCRNSFSVQAGKIKSMGYVEDVDECGIRCGRENDCHGFHYYQPIFPGGASNGRRMCDLIMTQIGESMWAPFDKPNRGFAGLKVGKSTCGDLGWNQDESRNSE